MSGIEPAYVADALENVAVKIGQKCLIPYFGGRLEVEIISVNPEEISVEISKNTNVNILNQEKKQLKLCKFCEKPLEFTDNSDFCSHKSILVKVSSSEIF